ncbi:MAG: hypothetical protein Q9165_007629 [Trypethelium subeluteriae]
MHGEDKGAWASCTCYAGGAPNPDLHQTPAEGSEGLPATKSGFLTKQPEEGSVSAIQLHEAFLAQLNKTRRVLQQIGEIQEQLGLSDSPHRLSSADFAKVANTGQACLDRVRREARRTRFEPGTGPRIATVEMMAEIDSALAWIEYPRIEIRRRMEELGMEGGWRGRPTRAYVDEVFQDVEDLRQRVRELLLDAEVRSYSREME